MYINCNSSRDFVNSIYLYDSDLEVDAKEQAELHDRLCVYYKRFTGLEDRDPEILADWYQTHIEVEEVTDNILLRIARVLEHRDKDGFILTEESLLGVGTNEEI